MNKQRNPHIEFGFHAVIPRIVRTGYKKLTPTQKWLYVCLKDLCGEHGVCYRTLDALAEETGISKQMISVSIPELQKAGLITAEKKKRAASSTKGVWHITIIDIWQANGKEHPTKKAPREYPLVGYSHDNKEGEYPLVGQEYPLVGQEYPTNGYHQTCEDASHVAADTKNEVVSRRKKQEKEEGGGTPPPLTFPSTKTLPGESLFPSDDIPAPAPSDVPANLQSTLDNWAVVLGVPALPLNDKLIRAAQKVAPLNLSVDDLRSIMQFCKDDNPGWYGDQGKTRGKVTLEDIAKNYEGWASQRHKSQPTPTPNEQARKQMKNPADEIRKMADEFWAERNRKAAQ